MLDKIFRRRQDEQRKVAAGRLPPGQSLTQKFPVLHYGPTPTYASLQDWKLRCYGLLESEVTLSWSQFNQLQKTKVTLDIHCVTRWSKFDTVWEGVTLRTLVDEGIVTPAPSAKYVVQHCEHGYTTNLPLEFMLQTNVLLATHFAEQPLTPDHGYPLRVVVGALPQDRQPTTKYFWKGGKWLRALEFRADDKPGFWEKAGYHNDADPWKEERYRGGKWLSRLV